MAKHKAVPAGGKSTDAVVEAIVAAGGTNVVNAPGSPVVYFEASDEIMREIMRLPCVAAVEPASDFLKGDCDHGMYTGLIRPDDDRTDEQ